MDDHGKSGSDVGGEKPRSGSSVSSELPREAALFPAVADQHAAAAPRTFTARPSKTSTEMSRVAHVPGGAADHDDSPADYPRSGIFATMAPNVGPYSEPGDDQRPDRDGRLLDDARFDDVGLPDDDDRLDYDNGQRQRLAYRFNARRAVIYAKATYEQPTTRTGGGQRSSNLLKRTKIHHRGPRTETDQPLRPTTTDVTWVSPWYLQNTCSSLPGPVYPLCTMT